MLGKEDWFMVDKGGIIEFFSQDFLRKRSSFYCVMLLFLSGIVWGLSFFHSGVASAAVLDVEILSNITTDNDSGTTASNRWSPTITTTPVNFEITGEAIVNASVNLIGDKYGVLVVPDELIGKVQPDGQATVDTSITIDLDNVPVLADTLTAVDSLVTLIDQIQSGALGSLVGVTIDFTAVNQQLALLDSFENFGSASFQEDLNVLAGGQGLYVNLDNGIGPILAAELTVILTNLKNAVNALSATGAPLVGTAVALAINTALAPVKLSVSTAINAVIPLLGVGGAGVQQLADASILGGTTIQMPTLVSGPGSITTDLDAKFVGTVIQTGLIDLNLLSDGNGVSFIYFRGEALTFNTNLLPGNLNFGQHLIQTAVDEQFSATVDGLATSQLTTGTVAISDTRSQLKNWQVKVNQLADFQTGTASLAPAILTIHGGDLVSDFPLVEVTSISHQTVELTGNTQQQVLAVTNSNATGSIQLALSQFDLFVPKNTPKTSGSYQTTLVWTVTDGP